MRTKTRAKTGRLQWLAVPVCIALGGCMAITPKVEVRQPTTERPTAVVSGPLGQLSSNGGATTGAIYQTSNFRGLFEDRRARLVGDVVTIQIQEKHSAKEQLRQLARSQREPGREDRCASRRLALRP